MSIHQRISRNPEQIGYVILVILGTITVGYTQLVGESLALFALFAFASVALGAYTLGRLNGERKRRA